jgi:hypothetical protein
VRLVVVVVVVTTTTTADSVIYLPPPLLLLFAVAIPLLLLASLVDIPTGIILSASGGRVPYAVTVALQVILEHVHRLRRRLPALVL